MRARVRKPDDELQPDTSDKPKAIKGRRTRQLMDWLRAKGYSPSRAVSDDLPRRLTRDFAFNRKSMQDGEHVSPFDNGNVNIGTDDIRVKLVQGIDEAAFKSTLSRATKATIGIEPGKVDESDWEEMLKGGLQTALETQVIVFEVAGVSRACTHQLVRSRRASFHQQSMRASYYGQRPEARMPESIWRNGRARSAFLTAMASAHEAYNVAVDEDVSYQDARFILPEATANYILLEYPVREFLNVYAYRACSMFQWEIVAVMRLCRAALVEAHPWMEPYVKISCEKTSGALDGHAAVPGERGAHHCTFQGWEAVEGQCDFPWARESNRSFRSERHGIERKPGPLQQMGQATVDAGKRAGMKTIGKDDS
jgi:flavin-dependent thymidylate synthase